MSMADFIIKVVKDSNRSTNYGSPPNSYGQSHEMNSVTSPKPVGVPFNLDTKASAHISAEIKGASTSYTDVEMAKGAEGIRKAVSVAVSSVKEVNLSTANSDEESV